MKGLSNLNWRWTCLSRQTMVQLNGSLLLFIVIFSPRTLISISWNRHPSCSPSSPPALSSYGMDDPLAPQRRLPSSHFAIHAIRLLPPPAVALSPSYFICCPAQRWQPAAPTETCTLVARTGRTGQPDQQGAGSLFISISLFLWMTNQPPCVGPDTPQTFRTLKLKWQLQQALLFIDNLFRCYVTS